MQMCCLTGSLTGCVCAPALAGWPGRLRGENTATRRASRRGPRVAIVGDPPPPTTLPDSSTKDLSGLSPRGEGEGLKGELNPSCSSSSGAPTCTKIQPLVL